MRRPLVIYDFATDPFWIFFFNMRKILFNFLSAYSLDWQSFPLLVLISNGNWQAMSELCAIERSRMSLPGSLISVTYLFIKKNHTDKKENIPHILGNSEGSGAKSYMNNDLLNPHIWWKYLCISSYIMKPSSYITFHPIPIEFPFIWEKFSFLFYQCKASNTSLNIAVYALTRKEYFSFLD
jgi:hypothetical protein